MMQQHNSLESLLEEIATLSGIGRQYGEDEVDFYVQESSLSPEGTRALESAGARRLSDVEEAEDAGGSKEAIRGTVDSICERMKGLHDFVDEGKFDVVRGLLGKIIKDMETLLEGVPGKPEKKEKPAAPPPKKKEGEGAEQAPPKKPKAQAQQQAAPAQPQQQAAKQESQDFDDCFVIPSVPKPNPSDPFGMGDGLLEDVMRRSFGRKEG
jgi:hypothetical protein